MCRKKGEKERLREEREREHRRIKLDKNQKHPPPLLSFNLSARSHKACSMSDHPDVPHYITLMSETNKH